MISSCYNIHSLTFLPKIKIHLWDHSRASFFVSSSDLASLFLSIFHSFINLFTSIVFFIFCFLVVFLLYSFFCHSIYFLSFPCSSFTSSSFCCSYSGFFYTVFYCLSHSFRHLIIFTSPVFQLILGLW